MSASLPVTHTCPLVSQSKWKWAGQQPMSSGEQGQGESVKYFLTPTDMFL